MNTIRTEDLVKYSSAVTLSDMEVFVFPELMYSLVLANIMSPLIWRWREKSIFNRLQGKSTYRTLMRLRQYVMDEYEFNLDLNTWGLTSKDVELNRFEDVISPDDIAASNALFGYEGDQYYFDVDIRRHFGLDQYGGDVIPYWKTETVEAMDAFRMKEGYATGAGECVSLSTLYAAAAFIVCGIPLDDIYMILTPLHSQNFIALNEGIITNNRRLVTKPMWFNGTEVSKKAQRALRNEQVTIVAHNTGLIHCFYDRASIDRERYQTFRRLLGDYLDSGLNRLNLSNFLRANESYRNHFQFCRIRRGEKMFIKAETLYGYEHGSRFRIYDETFEKLLDEVSHDDYSIYKAPDRMCCEELMEYIEKENIDIHIETDRKKLALKLSHAVPDGEKCVQEMRDFFHLEPRLPSEEKDYEAAEPIRIETDWDREAIIDYLESIRDKNITADLSFYAFRDMTRCDWRPFIKAAMERSPVSIEAFKEYSLDKAYKYLRDLPPLSIYEGPRLAQPDEVVNFRTGDGIEAAFVLANLLHHRQPDSPIEIHIERDRVLVKGEGEYAFCSSKGFTGSINISQDNYTVL